MSAPASCSSRPKELVHNTADPDQFSVPLYLWMITREDEKPTVYDLLMTREELAAMTIDQIYLCVERLVAQEHLLLVNRDTGGRLGSVHITSLQENPSLGLRLVWGMASISREFGTILLLHPQGELRVSEIPLEELRKITAPLATISETDRKSALQSLTEFPLQHLTDRIHSDPECVRRLHNLMQWSHTLSPILVHITRRTGDEKQDKKHETMLLLPTFSSLPLLYSLLRRREMLSSVISVSLSCGFGPVHPAVDVLEEKLMSRARRIGLVSLPVIQISFRPPM